MQKRFEALAVVAAASLMALATARAVSQQPTSADRRARFAQRSKDSEAKGLAEPFKGVTADGKVEAGLFQIRF